MVRRYFLKQCNIFSFFSVAMEASVHAIHNLLPTFMHSLYTWSCTEYNCNTALCLLLSYNQSSHCLCIATLAIACSIYIMIIPYTFKTNSERQWNNKLVHFRRISNHYKWRSLKCIAFLYIVWNLE